MAEKYGRMSEEKKEPARAEGPRDGDILCMLGQLELEVRAMRGEIADLAAWVKRMKRKDNLAGRGL